MKPLNYAILKYFTTTFEADAEMVLEDLRGEYGHFRTFKKKAIIESLMTAEANGLLEETRFDTDDSGNLRVFYHAPPEGIQTINRYIK